MKAYKIYFEKILSFLRVRMVTGGLEISDQVIRLAYFDGKKWQTAAVVLGPGVMEKGAIKDGDAVTAALRALRAKVPLLKNKNKKMNVVVSLSSANIYTQSFTLPMLEGSELDKAIDLNLQMASPDDLVKSYYAARILGRDETNARLEIAAAFIEKQVVDDLTQRLFGEGFLAIGVESRALSLVRMAREKAAGIDFNKSYILLDVDSTGIDFLVMRKGQLYFEYATTWADIADNKGQVTMEKFRESVATNLRQVMNFYNQHWPDPLGGIIVSSVVFKEEAEGVIKENTDVPIMQLAPTLGQAMPPEWFVALGASMRSFRVEVNGNEINLSGEGAMDAFREEQVVHFLDLWQILVPAMLAVFVLTLVLADNFLVTTQSQLVKNSLAGQGQQNAQMDALQASSTAFNQLLQVVFAAESHKDVSHTVLQEIEKLTGENSVSISRVTFTNPSSPISLSGVASSEANIAALKSAIEADPNFGTANLPLSQIQASLNQYSFSMTFPLATNAFQ